MQRIEKVASDFFPGQGHHGFDHTLRVRSLARRIARKEKADMEIVEAAALLHDIARPKEDSGKIEDHATEGAEDAAAVLGGLGFPEEKIEAVKYCIAVHRASKRMKAETKEAAILQDANRLDALGAIGIARVFQMAGAMQHDLYDPTEDNNREYAGEYGAALNHLIRKSIRLLKPESFNTKTGRKIAKQRHGFVKKFVERFIDEWKGEK